MVIDKQVTNLVNSQKNYDREKLSIKLSKTIEEFDPGSERTLAAGLTHASLKEVYFLGGRVSNT